MKQNNAVHTEPPIARFANGERFSGGPVTATVLRMKMNATFDRLLNAIKKRIPHAEFALRPPVKRDSIREAEKQLGYTLPKELTDLLLLHDGQEHPHDWGNERLIPLLLSMPLGNGNTSEPHSFLPLDEIVKRTLMWKRYGIEAQKRFGFDYVSDSYDINGPATYHVSQLVVGQESDVTTLDTKPTAQGTIWQVVTIDHDPPVISVHSPGIREHFEKIAISVENGTQTYHKFAEQ